MSTVARKRRRTLFHFWKLFKPLDHAGFQVSAAVAITFLTCLALTLQARGRKDALQYGAGLIVNVPVPEAEVVQAVEEVVQNGIIRGTKEYNKDEHISGATQARESRLFPAWKEEGKVYYKVRFHALDPRNFKDSGDVGTLAVRYVIMGQNETSTVLRIDALFAEDFRHSVHPSNGSVESSEYKEVHDRIEAIELMKQATADAEKAKQERMPRSKPAAPEQKAASASAAFLDKVAAEDKPPVETSNVPPQSPDAESSAKSLEERVKELRRQLQRVVKAPGAALKSAPFHTASNLQSLSTGTEVLIVVSTPYWYGVETHDGQHGWMLRNELEELP